MVSLVLVFLKSYWKHIMVIAAIAGVSFMAYNHIYNIGYTAANTACEKRIKVYVDELKDRINSLETASYVVSKEIAERDTLRKKDLDKLLILTKNKPLTIIKEGNCNPSDTFIEKMKYLLPLILSILLVSCATNSGLVLPSNDQVIKLDPRALAECDPLLSIQPPITFENVLKISLDNIELYAKCADKQKASIKLLKQISNIKE
jgi:hypothetical protein